MKTAFFFLIPALIFASCKKEPAAKKTEDLPPAPVYQQTDFAYGTDPKQKIDFSFIAGRSDTTPLTVLLHAGGWTSGDKADMAPTAAYFLSKGINVVNMNYRLADTSAGSVRCPDQVDDVNRVMQLLHDSAGRWRIRASGFVPFGYSAGGHLALLYSYSADAGNLTSADIGLGTPTKLDDPDWKINPYFFTAVNAWPPLTGEPWDSPAGNLLLQQYSPWYQTRFKPTFLIQGEKDQTVPFSQSQLMIDRLNQAGIINQYLPLPKGRHDGSGASEADLDSAYSRSAAWIRAYSH